MKKTLCQSLIVVFLCLIVNIIPAKAYNNCLVQSCDYGKIKLNKPELILSDEAFQGAIYYELLPYALEKSISGKPIEVNDVVEITYSVKKDDKIFNGLQDISDAVCVGSGMLDSTVEAALISKKKGDSLEVPTTILTHSATNNECFQVVYTIHIDNVSFYELPELTDTFVQQKFNIKTKEDFYSYVKTKEIIRRRTQAEQELKDVLAQILIRKSNFDQGISDMIQNRYDEVIEQYSKMADLYNCDVSDVMDAYGVSEYDILNTAEQQEKIYEICQYVYDKEKMAISSRQKDILNKKIMDEYYYEDIESFISDVGEAAYEEQLLVNYVLDFLYKKSIINERKYNAKQRNNHISTKRCTF